MASPTISSLPFSYPPQPASAADTSSTRQPTAPPRTPNINSTLCVSLLSGSVPKNWTTLPSLSDPEPLAVSVATATPPQLPPPEASSPHKRAPCTGRHVRGLVATTMPSPARGFRPCHERRTAKDART
ncbi:hypothetical protein HPP92_021223 [Vanilla planifolia]|uniref:Uncharacterized protein n=1 Tax=Vanilla planifolia TaxID=51239 RepID=A0A835Q7J8_VANPL|nr:hypothetical protein HPP92_021602 [Vanilla planifolia]KAG0462747.1 hypothetical protein HPP92_021223 [Vanilla planifolia]